MSSSWLDSYLAALEERDAHEKANISIHEAYTKLADHAAALAARPPAPAPPDAEAESPATATATATAASPHAKTATNQSPKVPPPLLGAAAAALTRSSTPPSTAALSAPSELARLRTDLSTAQKSKTALATQLAALEAEHAALRSTHDRTAAALAAATRDKAVLERKLKDRDSELRAKRELLERVQDEVVGLEMQVNVAEAEKQRLKEENQALVKRLVGEREVEVERVNRESGWG